MYPSTTKLIHLISSKSSFLNKPSCSSLRRVPVQNKHMKTFPQNKRWDSICRRMNTWHLGFKRGTPKCQKNPEIPNILGFHQCMIKTKNRNHSMNYVKNLGYDRWLTYKQPRQKSGLCCFSFARYLQKCVTKIYRALYRNTMFLSKNILFA